MKSFVLSISLFLVAITIIIPDPSIASQNSQAYAFVNSQFPAYLVKCGDGWYFWHVVKDERNRESRVIKEIKSAARIVIDESPLNDFDRQYGIEFRGTFSAEYSGPLRTFRVDGGRWTSWANTALSFKFGLKKENGKWSYEVIRDQLAPISCDLVPTDEPAIKVTEWTPITKTYSPPPKGSVESYIKGQMMRQPDVQFMIKNHGQDLNALNYFIGKRFHRPKKDVWLNFINNEGYLDWALVSRRYRNKGRIFEDVVIFIKQPNWGWAGIDQGTF